MKALFQGIGVLVHYNYALPYYLLKVGMEEIQILSNLLSFFMGGWYYYIKSLRKLNFKAYKSGINIIDSKNFVQLLEKMFTKGLTLGRYDIIHLNSYDHNFNIFSKAKIPKIFVLHGSLDYMDEIPCNIFEEISSKVDAVVAVSMYAANKLKEICGVEPSYVIHHGVDLEVFNPEICSKSSARKKLGIPLYNNIILWNARLSPEKRLETLMYALPYIIKENKYVIVLIKTRAINRSYELKILRLIKKLKVNEHVVFDRSWTPLIRMPVYYRAADVYVNTSMTEAFGSLAMLEAMACGVPTIANNASSNSEALGDGGLLYDTNDPYDLAEKILRVLTDNKLARVLGCKAYKRIKRELTLTNIAKKYIELYSSLKA
jgi:glycosyltransferase involved in cell wall biosynthesis